MKSSLILQLEKIHKIYLSRAGQDINLPKEEVAAFL